MLHCDPEHCGSLKLKYKIALPNIKHVKFNRFK